MKDISRKVAFLLALIWWAVIAYAIGEYIGFTIVHGQVIEVVNTFTVKKMDPDLFSGTRFYELRKGNTVLVISTDPKNDIAKFLDGQDKNRISVTFTGGEEK